MQGSLFKPGRIVATPGAIASTTDEYRIQCLTRHLTGDWGVVPPEDKAANDEALIEGNRILSAYPLDPKIPSRGSGPNTLWLITEADRSVTTFLLPEEY